MCIKYATVIAVKAYLHQVEPLLGLKGRKEPHDVGVSDAGQSLPLAVPGALQTRKHLGGHRTKKSLSIPKELHGSRVCA
jgi:hypothetical protein